LKVKQKTIKQEFDIFGIGLHTGCQVDLHFKPAQENTGVNFIRVDFPDKPVIKVCPENLCIKGSALRCTSIGQGEAVIHTVEHLLGVLAGLGITNLIIEINAEEIPGLDGSGFEFLKAIKNAGVVEQEAEAEVYKIQEPIGVEENGCSIYVVPSDEFKISYTLDYDLPQLRSQFFSAEITDEIFEKELAPCRTFCLESEAEELRAKGLGKGANYENTLVVGVEGVKENTVRFPDEFARHKVLDFIGDLYVFGMVIRGHVFAVKSGHELNIRLLKKIQQQRIKYNQKRAISNFVIEGKEEIDINGIMKILPHRYPFLLVDRVIEMEYGKRAVGIKNVTMNDDFFQGHFPTRPVMPGVLMVEAMAQTAGVIILTNKAHHGKVAFFMAVNNVKFRKVVSPGDQLVMEVEVTKDQSRIAQVKGVARVDRAVVAEAEMTFSFADAAYLEA